MNTKQNGDMILFLLYFGSFCVHNLLPRILFVFNVYAYEEKTILNINELQNYDSKCSVG